MICNCGDYKVFMIWRTFCFLFPSHRKLIICLFILFHTWRGLWDCVRLAVRLCLPIFRCHGIASGGKRFCGHPRRMAGWMRRKGKAKFLKSCFPGFHLGKAKGRESFLSRPCSFRFFRSSILPLLPLLPVAGFPLPLTNEAVRASTPQPSNLAGRAGRCLGICVGGNGSF